MRVRRVELQRLFVAERAKFSRLYPHVARTTLVVSGEYHLPGGREWRDVAQASPEPDGFTVHIVQRALRLPRPNLVALVRHELAHVADMTLGERETDALAMRVTGRPIRYDARKLQTTGRGGKRPSGLHR